LKTSPLGNLELASRIVLDEAIGSWFVVGIAHDDDVSELSAEIGALVDCAVPVMEVSGPEELIMASRQSADTFAVFFSPRGIDPLHLDDCRSMLQREHPAVLALPSTDLERLSSSAPHFTSWIANRVFTTRDDRFLDSNDRSARLAILREHFEMSDYDFVAFVEAKPRSLEPEQMEWLVLLGRQDLLKASR